MRPGHIFNVVSGLQWRICTRSPTHGFLSKHSHLSGRTTSTRTTTTMASPTTEPEANSSSKLVNLNEKTYEPIKEGLAYILRPVDVTEASGKPKPKPRGNGVEQQESVFYNPIQQFNRDLSVLAIKVFSDHFLATIRERAKRGRQGKRGKKSGQKRKREEDEDSGGAEGERETAAKKHESEAQAVIKEQNDVSAILPAANATNSSTDNNEIANSEATRPVSFKILDALSATGLRALRYAKEIPAATKIVSNDLSASAIEAIKLNIEYNGVNSIIRPNVGDARAYLYSLHTEKKHSTNEAERIGRFHVIDLDPYGTAIPFLDAAIQGLNEGGLLCVTCTDAGVFASTGYPEKAYSLYGGVPVRLPHGHEVGLRLLIHSIATIAGKYGLSVEPLLSLSIDYYARVFVRVHKSPAEVKFLSGNTMLVYNCDGGCGAWTTQYLTSTRLRPNKSGSGTFYQHSLAQAPTTSRTCEHCGFRTHLGGPMWGGPLHNPHFIQKILNLLPGLDRETYQTVDRIEGMLTTALEEDLDFSISKSNIQNKSNTEKPDLVDIDPSSPLIPRLPVHLQEKYPFFVNLSFLSHVLHAQTIPMNAFRGALHALGYRTTRSHTRPNSVRTDAPWTVIWEIMREWVRQKAPLKEGALKPGTAGAGIMKKDRSRNGPTSTLAVLRQEILEALESGRDVADLTTKVEAALYRRGATTTTLTSKFTSTAQNKTEPAGPRTEGKEKDEKEEAPHPSTLNIVFDEALGREFSNTVSSSKVVRYPMNPGENWGPMSRAYGH